MHGLIGNIRYAIRRLRLSPVFSAAAVLVLALGIGGTTAIFTLVDAIMLRSLPVSDPAQLYRIGDGNDCCIEGGPQGRWGMYSYALLERLRTEVPEFEQVTAFQAAAGFARMSVRRAGKDETSRPLLSEYVTGNYFSTLGMRSFGGRLFTPEDDRPGAPPVAVISYHVWETDYGSDPSVIGSTFIVEGHPFTVIGVGPPGFFGETLRSDPPEIWVPLQQEPMIDGSLNTLHHTTAAWLRVMGRLRPGASTAGMGARLTGVLRQWLRTNPDFPASFMPEIIHELPNQVINVVPAGAGVAQMKEAYARSLQILFVVCGLVLLIACANVANLLLARSASHRGQIAVRLAMGATRRQIVAQSLTESVVLAVAGSIAGLAVASAGAKLLLALAFRDSHFLPVSAAPSALVLGFALGLALVTGVVFGAAPAWFAARADPAEALRGSGRGAIGASSFASKGLLVLEAALSVVLVAGAGMLARSLGNLEGQDFGYRVGGRVLVALDTPPSNYTLSKLIALSRALEDRLNRLPGVRKAALALYNPLTNNWGEAILVEGHPPPKPGEPIGSSWDRVSAGYLQTLGMTILRGRGFTDADNENTAPVAVVNQAFVKRFFKSGEDPLGMHFGLDVPEDAGEFRIVGIVRDAKFQSWRLSQPALPMFYVPFAQTTHSKNLFLQGLDLNSHFMSGILLETSAAPGALEPVIKRALAEVDPNLTIVSVRTLREQLALSFNQQRAVASIAGLFGIIALLLAAVGLYGVTAYAVAQRTNEIGIRMALGADRGKVIRLILRGASVRVFLGLIIGVPLSIGAGRLISAQLYGVSSWDPFALGVAAATLAVCALFAALIPARRAASISPMDALRTE